MWQAYLERNVIVTDLDLKLLLSILVLRWPLDIIFPTYRHVSFCCSNVLHGDDRDIQSIEDARENAPYLRISLDFMIRLISSTTTELMLTVRSASSAISPQLECIRSKAGKRTLFPDQAVISVV